MIAEPGAAMFVEPASQLAVPPSTRRNNPFVTGLLFKNLPPAQCKHFTQLLLSYHGTHDGFPD